jgi:predicted nucleic acid-binding Zn ribbon protein
MMVTLESCKEGVYNRVRCNAAETSLALEGSSFSNDTPSDASTGTPELYIAADLAQHLVHLSAVDNDVLLYVGGASLRASISCSECSALIRRPVGEKVGVFLYFKEYNFVKDDLLSMTEPAAFAMRQLEIIYRANCDKVTTDKCVLQKLMTAASEVMLPACATHMIAFNERHKRLYMRLRQKIF